MLILLFATLEHVNASAQFSVRATVLSSLLAGITGALFYCTYTVAFVVGTEQVISGMAMPVIIKCFLSSEPNCRITGASVMCCIYGVILCVTYFGLVGTNCFYVLLTILSHSLMSSSFVISDGTGAFGDKLGKVGRSQCIRYFA